jgi:hypothetical protein
MTLGVAPGISGGAERRPLNPLLVSCLRAPESSPFNPIESSDALGPGDLCQFRE